MPGVPSGRGCEACRKQKKKARLQRCNEAQPTCARCSRLAIPCVGPGERRYKFHITLVGNKHKSTSASPTPTTAKLDLSRSHSGRSPSPISIVPSNRHTLLVSAFTARVHFHPGFDLRYHITWAFGTFLLEVPRRLGTNAALDAAAATLLLTHGRYATGLQQATRQELCAYSGALSTLRICLDDVKLATQAETLCAVMLLILCQYFIGNDGNRFSGHPEGAAKILKAKSLHYDPDDEFETSLLLTLRGPILFEGLYNPHIRFTPQEWRLIVNNKLDANSGTGNLLQSLSYVPDVLSSLRLASRSNDCAVPPELMSQVTASHTFAKMTLTEYTAAFDQARQNIGPISPRLQILKAHYQRQYSLGLFTTTLFNYLLRCMTFDSKALHAGLVQEAKDLANDIVALAYEARSLRPLGNGFLIAILTVGWVTAIEEDVGKVMRELWLEYAADSPGLTLGELEWSREVLTMPKALQMRP